MNTLIEAPPGLFFCEGHLEDIPISMRSSDPRYCRECCQFLEYEVSLLSSNKWGKPSWTPFKTLSNQNLGEKTVTPYPAKGGKVGKPKQLNFFATTSYSPGQTTTSDSGLEPLSAVLAKLPYTGRNPAGNESPGEYRRDKTKFGSYNNYYGK